MKRKFGVLQIGLAVMMVAAMEAGADTLTLKSGSVLVGKAGIVSLDGKLKFETEDLGALAVPTGNIVKLVAAAAENAAPAEVAVASLPVELKKPETWHGAASFGYTGKRGNTYANSVVVKGSVNRRWEHDRFQASAAYLYDESGTCESLATKSTDQWYLEGRSDHFWTEKNFVFVGSRYEEDAIKELDHRFRLFGGLGYQYWENSENELLGALSFNQQIGATYINEKYDVEVDNSDENTAGLTYRHEFKLAPKWNRDAEFFHNFEYVLQADNFLITADVGYTTKLVLNFNLVFKVLWDYDSRPSDKVDKLDTKYIVALSYKW